MVKWIMDGRTHSNNLSVIFVTLLLKMDIGSLIFCLKMVLIVRLLISVVFRDNPNCNLLIYVVSFCRRALLLLTVQNAGQSLYYGQMYHLTAGG